MNPRILELIKNPKNIQSEDLNLLKEEIHAFPYIQNIRALHLYGVHLYEKENYQKELSTTAAYTTDKKILYQLINGKIRPQSKPDPVTEKQAERTVEKPSQYIAKSKTFPIQREAGIPAETPAENEENTCSIPAKTEVTAIYVNGERNRILFEGEENFLNEENSETIDLESTLESGTLVTQKTEPVKEPETIQEEKEEVQETVEENGGEIFTPEIIIDEEEITSESEEIKVEDEENTSFEETEPIITETAIEEKSEESQQPENVEIPHSETEQHQDEPDAEVSFHGTDAFLPDVKIQTNNEEITETAEVSQPNINKHEDEMRRLIEEVEKKMKETKSVDSIEEKTETESVPDHEISFGETQSFHFWSTSDEPSVPKEEKEEPIQNEVVETQVPDVKEDSLLEDVEEEIIPETETPSVWKPMSVESNLPDSLISKSAHVPEPAVKAIVEETNSEAKEEEAVQENKKPEVLVEEELPVVEENSKDETSLEIIEEDENKTEEPDSKGEVPVMNVSFFGTDISSLSVEEKEKEKAKGNKEDEPVEEKAVQNTEVKKTSQTLADSNVPGFINTWQSWLKIDRTDEVEKEKTEIKEKAIEIFIENNPRISQLKEESTYVVKEKNDDISHLMTETLANLYFEQKLYTKAIKAFEILIKKTPAKKKYFESKIQEIKDFRSKN
ncbi:hypothetical protein [Chryseobacterium sp. Mn2064]|uniref:hypothetical protein n=1 Tax=Chryseobacterium sp. Mn2064 TaxID=3395263 RepID=UPI003BE3368C